VTVYLCDTNIWLALALSGHIHHAVARAWLETVEEPESILFCRATQQSFLRLLTNTAVMAPYGNPPLTNDEAWAAYEAFVADERIVLRPGEPDGLDEIWLQFALRPAALPQLWMDAYLAAFAKAEGCGLVTTNAAFRHFTGLDVLVLAGDWGAR
jgi:toxin-antitoxin system PIN domain toxin